MNWLAHLYLSEPNPQFRVGNLLPDLASAARLAHLPDDFQKGIRRHRQIDRYTDAHPRVHACVSRFPPPYRRFGGILTDVYFDHILARDWSQYSATSLPAFIREAYRDIEVCAPELPPEASLPLLRMRDQDWLGTYHTIPGINSVLRGISHRLRRPFDLASSLPIFQQHQSAFSADFHAFFPALMEHLQCE